MISIFFFPTEVSDLDIQEIADTWKPEDLDDLFPVLGLTDVQISQETVPWDRKKSAKKLLTLWRNSNPPDNTRADMLRAMSTNDNWKIFMDAVKKKWAKHN